APDPLADWLRVDTSTPPVRERIAQFLLVLDRDALDQQVQVQRAPPLELDLNEPLDSRPAPPRRLQQLVKVPPTVGSRQMLTRRQHDPERRRVFKCVE